MLLLSLECCSSSRIHFVGEQLFDKTQLRSVFRRHKRQRDTGTVTTRSTVLVEKEMKMKSTVSIWTYIIYKVRRTTTADLVPPIRTGPHGGRSLQLSAESQS